MKQTTAMTLWASLAILSGCSAAQPPEPPDVQLAMTRWSNSCALCHVDGNAGAPRVGNTEEWAPRVAQGMEVLLTHTIEGINDMPPLGYCMSCEEADFRVMIEFMTASNGAEGDQP